MTTKNFGLGVSRVLEDAAYGWEQLIFNEFKPPLDSEINLAQQVQAEERAKSLRLLYPSGFIHPSIIQGGVSGNVQSQNVIRFQQQYVLVNGWLIRMTTGTNQLQLGQSINIWKGLSNNPDEICFKLNSAPSLGVREDLVFLEVWRQVIKSTDFVYPYGNTQYADTLPSNDLIDEDVGRETTQRVQIRYRFRTEINVDFIARRNGLGDATIYAQAGKSSPVTGYPFVQSPTDPALFVAGDGSSIAQTALGSIDGYAYAIPIARIARRNTQPFSVLNPNGASRSLISGVSDRPDGLFHDLIMAGDIEDLRHEIILDNYENIAKTNMDALLRNQLSTNLADSSIVAGVRGSKLVQIDAISMVDQAGITDVQQPDGYKRIFSDALTTQKTSFTQNVTTTTMTITTPTGSPVGTIITTTPPIIYDKTNNGIILDDGVSIINGTWVGLGTASATYTPTIPAIIQNKDIVTTVVLQYPTGKGLTFAFNSMLKMQDGSGNQVDFNLYNGAERSYTLSSPRTINSYTDVARILPLSVQESQYLRGSVIEVDYHIGGNNSEILSIPQTVYGKEVLGVGRVYSLQTNDDALNPIITKIGTTPYGFSITLLTILNVGETMRITLYTSGMSVDYNPPLKELTEMGKAQYLSVTTSTALTSIVFPSTQHIIATSGFKKGTTYNPVVYIKPPGTSVLDYTMQTVSSLSGYGTPFMTAQFVDPVASGSTVLLPVMTAYALMTTEILDVIYDFIPYQGVVQNQPTTVSLEAEVVWVSSDTLVSTAGTGASGARIPPTYQGLIDRLPINLQSNTSDFKGEAISYVLNNPTTSLAYVPHRSYNYDVSSANTGTWLKVGDTIRITDSSVLQQTYYRHRRGRQLELPIITEKSPDLLSSVNHLNAIYGIAKGKGRFNGELLLFIITTTNNGTQIFFNAAGIDNKTVCSADFFKLNNCPVMK